MTTRHEFTFSFFIQKAIAGVFAGGIGGFAGMLIVLLENQGNAMTENRPDGALKTDESNTDRKCQRR